MKQLEAMMKHRGVTLIDVRPKDEYLKGHLPGAVSVPIPELRSYEKSFPPKKEIVAYCRCKYCVMADVIACAPSGQNTPQG